MPTPQRFIVYHIASTMQIKRFYREVYARRHAVKLGPAYACATYEHYTTNVVHMVTRINLESGLPYEEPSNTPCYMSPASESYWSM